MEEEKKFKIKLSTIIYLSIILLIIIALVIAYYFGFVVTNREKLSKSTKNQNLELNNEEDSEVVILNENKETINKENINNENEENVNINIQNENIEKNIKLGDFIVSGIALDPENDGIQSISLNENNEFVARASYASFYVGKYEIKENRLICTTIKEGNNENGTEEPLYKKSNIVFEFEILDDYKLKFVNVSNETLKATLNKKYIEESYYKELDDTKKIIGDWIPCYAKEGNEEISLQLIYGTALSLGGYLTFYDNGTYTYYVGAYSIENEDEHFGSYAVDENEINLLRNSGIRETLIYEENTGNILMKVSDNNIVAFERIREY